MACCIGFGDFNKKYIYILLSVLFKFISQITIGLGYSCLNATSPLSENLSKSSITYFISTFIFSILIGIFCYIKISKKENNDEQLISRLSYSSSSAASSISKKLNQKKNINKKIRALLLLVGFIFVFCEVYDQLFYFNGLSGLDFWMFEIIILSFFMRKILNYRNSIHHKISLYICVSSSFIIKVISNLLDSRTIEDEFNNKKSVNIYDYIKYKYSHWLYIPLFIFSFLIMTTFRSFGNTTIKYLMDISFVPPYVILTVYGTCGLFFCILYIFFDLIFDKEYLGVLNAFKNKFATTFICAIIYGVCNSLKIFFNIIFIKELSPFYIFAKFKIYYVFIQIILLCHKFIDKFRTFYFVEFTSDIICFFGFLIYLELIELRCCGLNYNLKKNIKDRSYTESDIKEYNGECKDDTIKIMNNIDNIYLVEMSD